MLNTFPSLLSFMMIAPLILRTVLGFYFIEFGYSKVRGDKINKIILFEKIGLKPGNFFVSLFGTIEFVVGIFLLAGIYTQISAMIAGIISILAIYFSKKHKGSFTNSSSVFFLLAVIAISLIFTGAGLYSIDSPL